MGAEPARLTGAVDSRPRRATLGSDAVSPGRPPVSQPPEIAQKAPYAVEVTAGKTYFWCACGRSAKQPFCDGSHKGTGFEPVRYMAAADGRAWFCGCKHSAKAPMCDGSHKGL